MYRFTEHGAVQRRVQEAARSQMGSHMRRRRGAQALARAAAAGRGAALRSALARRGSGAVRPPTATAGVTGL